MSVPCNPDAMNCLFLAINHLLVWYIEFTVALLLCVPYTPVVHWFVHVVATLCKQCTLPDCVLQLLLFQDVACFWSPPNAWSRFCLHIETDQVWRHQGLRKISCSPRSHRLLRLRRQRCRTLAKSTWQKMTVTFGSRELASRKWSDSCLFAENLKRLLQKTRCVNCTKMFVVDDNNDEACHYHPGPTQTALRNQNHLDRIIFHCCGGEQVGFSPVLYECPPCKVGRHVSAEEKEDQQKAGAKKWRIRESIIRVREFKALILICLYDHLTCFVVEKCHTLKLSVQKINVWKQWEAIESA